MLDEGITNSLFLPEGDLTTKGIAIWDLTQGESVQYYKLKTLTLIM